jgi:two-component system, OmpR family, alkaline phosphatase synthesis response regulator PhoP
LARQKILVVDDSEIVLTMAREALEGAGFQVLSAASTSEADPLISGETRPDLIILDVMLPTLDGDKKAKMLKAAERTRDIPILLISSKPEDELRRRVKESGADGYIRKPFTVQGIVDRVREAIAASAK